MWLTVKFTVDLADLEAELEAVGLEKTVANTNEVLEEIRAMVKGMGEDSDAIFDAVDTILDRR